MGLITEWIHYGKNGEFSGYAARMDSTAKAPAIIIIQEIWGVDEHIQDVTRRFAQAGYVAFAPDLYTDNGHKSEELQDDRIEEVKRFMDTLPPAGWSNQQDREDALNRLPEPERTRVSETFHRVFFGRDMEKFMEILLAASSFLRNKFPPAQGQGVSALGFCMGGALAAIMAGKDPQLSGAVIFYGSAPSEELIPAIQCPVIGFYGQLDPRITDAVPAFAESMKENGKLFESHVYEGAHHAFFNDTRSSYHSGAARDAYLRALEFLHKVNG